MKKQAKHRRPDELPESSAPVLPSATDHADTLDADTLDADTLDADTLDADTLDADTLDADTVDADTVDAAAVESESAEAREEEESDPDFRAIIEALVFASDEPLTFKQIKELLAPNERDSDEGGEDDTTGTRTKGGGNGNAIAEEASPAEATSIPEDASTAEDASVTEDASVAEAAVETAPGRGRRSAARRLTITRVKSAIDRLNEEYADAGRVFRIVEVAGGFAFQTTAHYGAWVGRLFAERARRRLTQSALETLAIIAFRQPISKPAIEGIRGVNAEYVVKSLLERNLISIVGREDSPGRPLLYGTTKTFLKHFGLSSINDLPKPREIKDLLSSEEELGINPIDEMDPDQARLLARSSSQELERLFDTAVVRSGENRIAGEDNPEDAEGAPVLHVRFDSEGGSDGDSDIEIDSDIDGESEIESEIDIEPEIESEFESDIDGDIESEPESDIDGDIESEPESDIDGDIESEPESDIDGDIESEKEW